MPESPEPQAPRASAQAQGEWLDVAVSGDWRITAPTPIWNKWIGDQKPAGLRIRTDDIGHWDTSLLLFICAAKEWCGRAGIACDLAALPEKMRALLGQLETTHTEGQPRERRENPLSVIGLATLEAWTSVRGILQFVGECVYGAGRMVRRPGKFRWRDCLDQMQECGAMGLPIVSLISFLMGLTLAYQAAVELRQFGADIYVADIVGLSIVREMGPMMAAVILAGRTGAAFAAELGNMKADEEIDALEVLGISAVDFLVLPRLLAIGLMMPLLALYADCVGILGGMAVAAGVLQIPPSAFLVEAQTIVDLSDINTGLIKATTFGLLIGLSGCLRGLQADRSAAGVGRAATSAVVTAILLIIVADSLYAVLFHLFGL
jgi:phospholipid/cholesterol/gamma-HCH transport system permease protein